MKKTIRKKARDFRLEEKIKAKKRKTGYYQKTTKAGDFTFVEKVMVTNSGEGRTRAERREATKDAQKKINKGLAARKLQCLICENFTGGEDLYLTLTYKRKKGESARTYKQIQNDLRNFKAKLKKLYEKLGQVFKYIQVIGYGKLTSRHVHMIIPYMDVRELAQLWKFGEIQTKVLWKNNSFENLAEYFIKHTKDKIVIDGKEKFNKWSSSQNLKRPETKIEKITNRNWFREDVKAPKGWSLYNKEVTRIENEIFGFKVMRYTLMKLDTTRKRE